MSASVLASGSWVMGQRAKWPRHDGCVKPKRASRKTVEEPLGKRGEERKVPEESDKVVKKTSRPESSQTGPRRPATKREKADGFGGSELRVATWGVAEPQRQGASQWPR